MDIKDHTKSSMENVKRGWRPRAVDGASFLYMQAFFRLRSDDSAPNDEGASARLISSNDLTAIYNTYFTSCPVVVLRAPDSGQFAD